MGVDASEDGGMLGELMNSVPGIDEATSFGEVIKQVNSLRFDLVIFWYCSNWTHIKTS